MTMTPHSDLAIITCYFNPHGYQTKRLNFDRFAAELRFQGHLIIVECAFGNRDFELPQSMVTMRVRATDILWQKERLINIGLASLPPYVTKVAWIDCDLLFTNRSWVAETAHALETFAVVQPFETAVRLPQGIAEDDGAGERYNGFGAVFNQHRVYTEGRNAQRHGHTGFAWAARRSALPHGLYQACLSGNGDHLMSHAFAGDWETPCFRMHFEGSPAYKKHFDQWCCATYPHIRGRIGYVPGTVLHLWHGDDNNRKYMLRDRELSTFAFDPETDLREYPDSCFEWNSDKPELHSWARNYFVNRDEDGTNRLPS